MLHEFKSILLLLDAVRANLSSPVNEEKKERKKERKGAEPKIITYADCIPKNFHLSPRPFRSLEKSFRDTNEYPYLTMHLPLLHSPQLVVPFRAQARVWELGAKRLHANVRGGGPSQCTSRKGKSVMSGGFHLTGTADAQLLRLRRSCETARD